MKALGALDFSNYSVEAHRHRHHVFTGEGRGAELEFARGCPWSCNFCNKTLFRNKFRERNVDAVIAEVDRLVARGVDYIYFIDEIFGVGKNVLKLLDALAERDVKIGFQTRIDLWTEETLDLLGRAGCISMEVGIESITDAGRDELNKNCRISTERITELLIYARTKIPWVQANLILTDKDDKAEIRRWQEHLKAHGVWVSEPVPMFPFPGSPSYVRDLRSAAGRPGLGARAPLLHVTVQRQRASAISRSRSRYRWRSWSRWPRQRSFRCKQRADPSASQLRCSARDDNS